MSSCNDRNEKLTNALSKSVYNLIGARKKIPISFSGGIDSYITAALAKKYSNPILYTIGNLTAKDILYSKIASKSLGCPLEIINLTDGNIENGIRNTIKLIGQKNSLDVLIATSFYLIAERISKDDFDVCLSGQGADELFFGYDKYRRALADGNNPNDLRNKDLIELEDLFLNREYKIFENFNLKLLSPFFDEEVKKIGIQIEREHNLRDANDDLRKHTLREIARDLGAPPEIIARKKKAFQYGSGILQNIRKISKEKNLPSSLNAYLEYIKK